MATGELFAVTTRSRLRGPWLFPAMMVASLRVRRQLGHAEEVVRWASVVTAPTEFWTITVWRSRHEMQEFMRSGAHDDIMWLFSRWLRSFWLMRWRPGSAEVGTWDGLTFAPPEPEIGTQSAQELSEPLRRALEHLPWLKAATGSDGAATYDSTPFARRHRAEVASAGGAVVHLHTSVPGAIGGLVALSRLKRVAASHGDLLRAAIGVGRPGDAYLLCVFKSSDSARRLVESTVTARLARRWPEGFWANQWIPENEFGHWDGLRVRRTRTRHGLRLPPAAREAAGSPG